jgi:hypothetical protein
MRKWPRELRQSISLSELKARGAPPGLLFQEDQPELIARVKANYVAELRRRAQLMLAFFDLKWPQSDTQWMSFLMVLCEYWHIKGDCGWDFSCRRAWLHGS